MATKAYSDQTYARKAAQQNLATGAGLAVDGLNNIAPNAALTTGAALAANALKNAQPNANASASSSGGASAGTVVATNPYADLYSIYEQQLNAQKNALEQQRQARLGALQSNYANAKNQLSGAFDSGENQINTDADNALRESYINMMLNQKRLNQQLQSQGLNGGAMESSLARAYNDYGSSRNNIEQGRLDNIGQLLREYQNSLGDVEANYQNNLANLDADYSGNIANAVSNYYDTIAKLQAQNAASSLKNALGKSSANINTGDSGLDKNLVSLVKGFKDSPSSAVRLLNSYGIYGDAMTPYLWAGQIDPTLVDTLGGAVTEATVNNALGGNALAGLTQSARNNIINTLKRVASLSKGTREMTSNVAAQMDQLAKQYGLTQEQASALLAEAGF